MKKGITPVIAIILLLLITISMVGFAFVWFSRVAQTATEQTEKQLQSDLSRQGKKIAIDNLQLSTGVLEGSVSIRNIGTSNIAAGDIKLYVNNAVQVGCDSLALAAGAVGSCDIDVNTCNSDSGNTLRVTAPGNQDQVTCGTGPGGAGGAGGGQQQQGGGGPPPPP